MRKNKGYVIVLVAVISICLGGVTGCGGSTDTEIAGYAPTVSSTNPGDTTIDVAINRKVAATFSEAMDPVTLTTATFTLKQGETTVPGTVASVENIATFTPTSALATDTEYTATITTGAKNLLDIALADARAWTFTTGATADTSAPVINSTNPIGVTIDVAINRNIAATFSEAMDPATITTDTFFLEQGTTLVPGTVTSAGSVATFNPTSDLEPNTAYTATITTGVMDLSGVPLASDSTWAFTTGTTTAAGPAQVNLGTAGSYVILAKSGVSTTGATAIVGDIGLSPAAASFITGFGLIADALNTFSTSSLVDGRIYAANYTPPTPANMTTAVSDMEIAFTDAAGRTLPDHTELGAGDISGMTLAPGLYKWGTGVLITGGVTLDGSADDVWIFQIGEDLTVENGAIVTLSGGALPENIFWQVSGQAILGTTSQFKGIILSQTLISLNTGAALTGRALAQTAVTLDATAITAP